MPSATCLFPGSPHTFSKIRKRLLVEVTLHRIQMSQLQGDSNVWLITGLPLYLHFSRYT